MNVAPAEADGRLPINASCFCIEPLFFCIIFHPTLWVTFCVVVKVVKVVAFLSTSSAIHHPFSNLSLFLRASRARRLFFRRTLTAFIIRRWYFLPDGKGVFCRRRRRLQSAHREGSLRVYYHYLKTSLNVRVCFPRNNNTLHKSLLSRIKAASKERKRERRTTTTNALRLYVFCIHTHFKEV